MEFNDKVPIYTQLIFMFEQDIAAGKYAVGEKLPSRRDLAQAYRINPNTVQRAYKELEETGVIETIGNQGSFVTRDQAKVDSLRQRMLEQATDRYFDQVQALNISKEDLKAYLQEYLKGGEENAGS